MSFLDISCAVVLSPTSKHVDTYRDFTILQNDCRLHVFCFCFVLFCFVLFFNFLHFSESKFQQQKSETLSLTPNLLDNPTNTFPRRRSSGTLQGVIITEIQDKLGVGLPNTSDDGHSDNNNLPLSDQTDETDENTPTNRGAANSEIKPLLTGMKNRI